MGKLVQFNIRGSDSLLILHLAHGLQELDCL